MVEPLREMLGQFADVVAGYRERSGERICGSLCDLIPPEIPASRGMRVLRVPAPSGGGCRAGGLARLGDLGGVYDCVVIPDTCARRDQAAVTGAPLVSFAMPTGWGEGARRILEERLDAFLRVAGCGGLSAIDAAALAAVTGEYNGLRRLVRGIAAARREKPELLSCRDLAVVMEAAAALPPAVTRERLAAILGALGREEGRERSGLPPVLVYAGCAGDSDLFDEIEEEGCLIVEDDTCSGRRQFDMSHDPGAADLAGEILDACTYRPLCPSVRPPGERVELFYAMLKSHGIEAVIFIEDLCCPARQREIAPLRVRLMRSGVDPLLMTRAGAAATVRDYLSRA